LEVGSALAERLGTRGDVWVHPKGAKSMPSLGSALEMHWLVGCFCLPCKKRLRKLSLHFAGPPFQTGKLFFPVCTSGCWPIAMTIASLLMNGCGLSHEHVKDGAKFGD